MPAPIPQRLAVLSYHSSPLQAPGQGDGGGMSVYVRAVAHALASRGVHTDVFTRAVGDLPRIVDVSDRVRVIAIEAGPRRPLAKELLPAYIDDFTAGIRAFATTQRIGYDLIHSHYWQSGLAALALARSWSVPVVHSHHTLARVKNQHLAPGDAPEPQGRLDGEAAVIAGADVLIASTDYEWEQLACLYGASHDSIKTIHPGVDHDLFTPGDKMAARRALGWDEDAAVLLAVGRIQPLKGLDLAIRTVEQLVSAVERPVVLQIVGGASGTAGDVELARLRSLVDALGLHDNVRFVGPQPHADLPDHYRAADALLACSYSESFGLAAVEAHACGIPVVATRVGGLSFVVRDDVTGWLLDRDPTEFATRLKLLLGDRALHASFSAAAHNSARRFSWERTGDALFDLYECLATEMLPEACTC